MESKTCTKCGLTKPVSEFYPAKKGRTGTRADCKKCVIARTAKWIEEHPEQRKETRDAYCEAHKEELAAYLRDWRKDNPGKSKEYRATRYANHKEDVLAATAAWVKANPLKQKDIMRKWYVKNKEKVDQKSKEWADANPEKMREYSRKNAAKKREDPKHRLECSIRSGVMKGLKRGAKAGRKTFNILGYTPQELKEHLERLFLPGMTWENYGEWHIDHIIPLAAHNYETPDDIDFKKAWALSNLQPLWATDNMKKRDKLSSPFQPSLAIALLANDNQKKETKVG